jgi:hypothetical protein
MKAIPIFLIGLGLAAAAQSQSPTGSDASGRAIGTHKSHARRKPGPGREAANGGGDVAKGVGKGAGDLATLHPVKAVGAVGKGAGEGTYKVGRGIGGGIAKLFHHSHHSDDR